jgi:hypothetical protein
MSTPTRQQFADDVLKMVGEKFPLVKITPADQPFSMKVNGHVASLENLYRMSILRPDQTRRHVERWIVELIRASEGAPDVEGSFEELKDRVLPLVVPEVADPQRMSVIQPFVPGLSIAYGIDNDRTISHITRKRLAKWRVTVDEMHETALENLVKRSQSLSAHAAQDAEGNIELMLFQTMDGYDASRVLLPDLHTKLREHLGSPFAAAIPNRDILLCFRSDDHTVAKLRPQIQTDYSQMPHQVTDQLLLVTADGIAMLDSNI